MADSCFLGIDVGGTSLKVGAMNAAHDVLGEQSIPTPADSASGDVLGELERGLHELRGDRTVAGIGVGLPGALDRERGLISMSPNLPWLQDVPMRDELARRFDLPPERVLLENDANVAALGEQAYGVGRGLDDMMFVTLGTGIGSGLVLHGKLHVGGGLACEAGHVCVDSNGPVCGCGNRGCVETVASASAASRRAEAAGLPPEKPGCLETLASRARATPGPERDLLVEIGKDLGRGLAAVVVVLDVRTYVFGGGFAEALDVLTPGIMAGIHERLFPIREMKLLHAQLGNRAGWMGAARLAIG